MKKCEMKIEKKGNNFKIFVIGTVDEDFVGFHSLTGAERVELNLGQVKGINSCGIRDWIKWISSAGSAQMVYVECPKIIVDQINMVQGFLPPGGIVQSFYVPYYSEQSGEEKNILFTLGNEFSSNGINPPTGIKDGDGNEMEMDIIEAKYFKFIKK